MKLLVCADCQDVIKLDTIWRYCKCHQSGGRYADDGRHAAYFGKRATLIGVFNMNFWAMIGGYRTHSDLFRFNDSNSHNVRHVSSIDEGEKYCELYR